ncbi:hypothetical protein BV25DRAFT_1832753 [Artomyces pyxidatus]|uniref:Uncharacterized protein n=1 Tax=Artomyces pyxidatus TaxID=48021 RepID=A0ACB8SHH7_9AGAM|nr:hypothetical protein BV25DRAFT_1832753 [Artomyces pyxidatus]
MRRTRVQESISGAAHHGSSQVMRHTSNDFTSRSGIHSQFSLEPSFRRCAPGLAQRSTESVDSQARIQLSFNIEVAQGKVRRRPKTMTPRMHCQFINPSDQIDSHRQAIFIMRREFMPIISSPYIHANNCFPSSWNVTPAEPEPESSSLSMS